jgi:hypothetical protein
MKVNIPDPVRRISKEEGEGKMLSWRYDWSSKCCY